PGGMARATVSSHDPAAQAHAFAEQGFTYLHLVDLDGAFAGKPVNAAAVERILAAVKIPVQLGGGIRDRATIDAWLDKGVARVIVGTAAGRRSARGPAPTRAGPRWGARRATARAGSKAGRNRRGCPRSTSPAASKTLALRPSFIPMLIATACLKDSISMQQSRSPKRFRCR